MWLLPSSNEDEADPPLPGAGPDGVATINQKLCKEDFYQPKTSWCSPVKQSCGFQLDSNLVNLEIEATQIENLITKKRLFVTKPSNFVGQLSSYHSRKGIMEGQWKSPRPRKWLVFQAGFEWAPCTYPSCHLLKGLAFGPWKNNPGHTKLQAAGLFLDFLHQLLNNTFTSANVTSWRQTRPWGPLSLVRLSDLYISIYLSIYLSIYYTYVIK